MNYALFEQAGEFMISPDEAATLLLQARIKRKPLAKLPDSCCPQDVSAAYQCQNALTEKMLKQFGGKRIGYKVGCTNQTAQTLLNVDGPFYGPLLSPFVFENTAKLRSSDFFMRVIEPEFAFVMADALHRVVFYTPQEEVFKAIGAVVPAIEIVDSRYKDWTAVGGPSFIADNACNAAWIHGQPNPNWSIFDFPTHEVNLYVNDVPKRKGNGLMVLGNPLNAVTWLANALSEHGNGLQSGDFVSTGLTSEIYMAKLGDHIKADFGPIGSVEFSFIS